MAGDFNAKHVDCNSRMTTRRGKLLRDYADGNSCLNFVPDTPTTSPYNPFVIPDVSDIVLTQNLTFPVYLTSCSALNSDYLPVLIETACRSSFLHPQDRHEFRRTEWVKLLNGMAIDTCVENFSGAVLKALEAFTPKRRPRDDTRPPIPAGIQNDIRLKNWLRSRWQITRDPALKAEVNRLQRSVIRLLNESRNDQWSATLESLDFEDQSLWRVTKRVMRVPTPLLVSRGESLPQTLRKLKPLPTIWRLNFNR
jgi:hypothetical protein